MAEKGEEVFVCVVSSELARCFHNTETNSPMNESPAPSITPLLKSSSRQHEQLFSTHTGVMRLVQSPRGVPDKEGVSPQTRAKRLHSTRLLIQDSSALHFCAVCPYLIPPLFCLTSFALHTHASFTPQHWLCAFWD